MNQLNWCINIGRFLKNSFFFANDEVSYVVKGFFPCLVASFCLDHKILLKILTPKMDLNDLSIELND